MAQVEITVDPKEVDDYLTLNADNQDPDSWEHFTEIIDAVFQCAEITVNGEERPAALRLVK